MRPTIGVLACAAAGLISLAYADPPAQAPAAAASQPAAPQASAASATAPATVKPEADSKAQQVLVQSTPEVDVLEKHFLSEGYKMEMHNGEKVFCRREEQLGSRLGAQKVCGTAQQLQATEREAQAAYQRGQSQQNNPSGR